MHIAVVLNKDGGSLKTMDLGSFSSLICETFEAKGHSISVEICSGKNLETTLKTAAKNPKTDCLMAGGGDGTISCAAAICREHKKILGVLPAGTMNLFARTLNIPLDLEEAVEQLADGKSKTADVSTANGRVFLHQVSVGMQPKVIRERATLTYRSRFGKMIASARAILRTISYPPSFNTKIVFEDHTSTTEKLSMIAVSNNPHAEGHMPYADTIDAGVMGFYTAPEISASANAKLMTDLFIGSWSNNPDLTVRTVKSIELVFPRRKKRDVFVIDGELIKLEDRLKVQIHPKSLKVLVPVKDGSD